MFDALYSGTDGGLAFNAKIAPSATAPFVVMKVTLNGPVVSDNPQAGDRNTKCLTFDSLCHG